mgnify:CR=1 FL=1
MKNSFLFTKQYYIFSCLKYFKLSIVSHMCERITRYEAGLRDLLFEISRNSFN